MDLKLRIIEVLESGHLISLGTVDNSGVWVADVVYIYDDELRVYWMSSPDFRHSQALLGNEKIAGSITVSNKSKESNFGIQLEGIAKKIDGDRFDLAVKHLSKRGYTDHKREEDILINGYSWYMLTPTRIDLIDEDNLGFNKQTLEL